MKFNLEKLFIDRSVINDPVVCHIRESLNIPSLIVDDISTVYQQIDSAEDPIGFGKKVLYLTRNKGAFIKKCPGTKHYKCCSYKILHVGSFCTMDCSYCILQIYFHPPMLIYFVNQNDMLTELNAQFDKHKIQRIGTGEFTDSLIWDQWIDLSKLLIKQFSGQSSCVLELKTKTAQIDHLSSLEHNRKTIMSWSLNSRPVIQNEEKNTSSIEERLTAAQKCQASGYALAFHFDPIVIYDGCIEDYKSVVDLLFKRIYPENIAWISLGTFRYIPYLKKIIGKRFSSSNIIYGEFIPGLDGKMRYFRPLRTRVYKAICDHIRQYDPNVMVYLCMEDDLVWAKAIGFTPKQKGGLKQMLDQSAANVCHLSSG